MSQQAKEKDTATGRHCRFNDGVPPLPKDTTENYELATLVACSHGAADHADRLLFVQARITIEVKPGEEACVLSGVFG